MRIGINASFLRKPNTGIGQVTINFLKKLIEGNRMQEERYEDIEFYLYVEDDLPVDLDLPKNFKVRKFLPLWKRDDLIRKILWENFLLPKKIKADKCDVFLSLYQSGTILDDNIEHIMIVHDLIPRLFPDYRNNVRKEIYWNLTERGIKNAGKVITVSERTKEDLKKYLLIGEDKININYPDVDAVFKQELSEEKSQDVLGRYGIQKGYLYSGGGLEMRKNIKTLIYAYERLLSENKNIPTLVISGKLMPELAPLITDVEKIVKDLKIEDKIKLLGFVPQEDLPYLYKNASLFVYPSIYEGFGLPVLEAMNQGVPVLISNNSSVPEVGGEGAPIYFDPNDLDDLTDKIKMLLNDRERRNELSIKSKERAKEFSWEKFTKKILDIIEK